MPLENYNLDDTNFQDLVEEAKRKISEFSQKWTNHNISDPGITLIDLFAWITEIYSYSINKIPEKNYLKFLKLIGIQPMNYILPILDLKVQSDKCNYHLLKHGTTFYSEGIDVKVTTLEDLFFAGNLYIKWIFSYSNSHFQEETSKILNEKRYFSSNSHFMNSHFFPFGRYPESGNSFFIGLREKNEKSSCIKMPNCLTVFFNIYNDHLPYFSGQKDSKIRLDLNFENISQLDDLTRQFTWEYADRLENGGGGVDGNEYTIKWKTLNISKDTTRGFTRNGQIVFKFPTDDIQYTNIFKDRPEYLGIDYDAIWIRCYLHSSKYQNPPRFSDVLLNTVPTEYSNSILASPLNMGIHSPDTKQENCSNGLPNQKFELIDKSKLPIIKINYLKIGEDEKDRNLWTNWIEVEDFYSSKFYDKHYTLDKDIGIVMFGDGVHGEIPIKGHKIILEYIYGDIDNMIIKQNSMFVCKDTSFTGISISDSTRGIKKETLKDAIIRARKEINTPSRAVSASDYEYIAKNTPGIIVARAKAYSSGNMDNIVNVIVVPYSENLEDPVPNNYFLDCVKMHLDRYRLITTKIKVIRPSYRRIKIECHLVINSNANESDVKRKVDDLIRQNFRIIPKTHGDEMRDFGKNVYRSEISFVIKSVNEVNRIKSINIYDSDNRRYCEKILISDSDMSLVVVDEVNITTEKDTIKRTNVSSFI